MSEAPGAAEADVSGPLAQLHSVLIAGETLEAWVIQRRAYALTHRRVLIAATSGRLIVLTRRLLGGFGGSLRRSTCVGGGLGRQVGPLCRFLGGLVLLHGHLRCISCRSHDLSHF